MTENPLVSTDWLEPHLYESKLRIVNIRGHVLPANESLMAGYATVLEILYGCHVAPMLLFV